MHFNILWSIRPSASTDGELIVGEKGPFPKATPTYPELCCHSLSDLEILDSREKIPFSVSPEAKAVYRDSIIPFWQGKSLRDMIFSEMTDAWKAAYEAGVFTEFMEQRAPGHTVLDDKIYKKGFLEFRQEIASALSRLDYLNDPKAYARQEELKAMEICADALIRFSHRHAEKAIELWRSWKPGRSERPSWNGLHRSVSMFPQTPHGIFTKRCSITGSFIWGSPSSSTPGMPLIRGDWTSI